MKVKDLLGKEMRHEHLGKVLVTEVPKGSRANVIIKCIDRGAGWDDTKETYKGIRKWLPNTDEGGGAKRLNWSRGQNYQYGVEDVVHKNSLKPH